MNYSLIKLQFLSAVHFGPSDSALSLYTSEEVFHADTLFSALCQMALDLCGPEGAERLCRAAEENALRLTDAMPWRGETFYLPKPMVTAESREAVRELPAGLSKAMKKLVWIPVEAFGAFSASLAGGKLFDPEPYAVRFSETDEVTRVQVSRERGKEDNEPYQVGIRYFLSGNLQPAAAREAAPEDCGLYVLLACETEELSQWLTELITALGHSGIGGKTGSGYGRFAVEQAICLNNAPDAQTKWLYQALTNETARGALLLTASLPREEELEKALEGASFQLLRRGGFLRPDGAQETGQKKQTQYFLAPGSVLRNRFEGAIYSVCPGAGHPVYRYGKPVFLGVEL